MTDEKNSYFCSVDDDRQGTDTCLHTYKIEEDEVLVVSIEVLEINVNALRNAVAELKTELAAADTRRRDDIKWTDSELRKEILWRVGMTERELKDLSRRVEDQLREMRARHNELNDKVDRRTE